MRQVLVVSFLLTLVALTAPPDIVWAGEGDPAAPEPKVEVLDPGAEPRQLLRYVFKEGRKETMVMDLDMAMEISLMGAQQPEMNLPTMRMIMEVEVQSVTPEGNARYSFKITGAEVIEKPDTMPGMTATMETGLKSVIGMSGWAVITPRGITKDADVSLPEGTDPSVLQTIDSMKQQMKQMSAPLPLEAVGLGAKWRFDTSVEAQGISLNQTATYEMVDRMANLVQLKMGIAQKAERQMMDLPNLPSGATAELLALDSTGGGKADIDLGKLIPQIAMDLKMAMKCNIRAGAEEAPMSMKMRLRMTMEPRETTEAPEDD